jgi:mannitol/fructose-specific phosphotransferase system IIA component (Ntr-type)
MKVYSQLTPQTVTLDLKPGDKTALIKQLVDLLPLPPSLSRKNVVEEIKKREAISSTGIGEGVAIPHAKIDIEEDLLFALGVCQTPQPFEALDQKPVQIFITVVSRKDATGPHIRALAQLARLMQSPDFREKLLAAKTPEEAIRVFQEEEEKNG